MSDAAPDGAQPADARVEGSDARSLARDLVMTLQTLTHRDLDGLGPTLGLSIPPTQANPGPTDRDEVALSKRQRLERAFDTLSPSDYITVCTRFLQHGDLTAGLRNRVEDFLWSRENWPAISVRTRRELAEALDATGEIWLEADGLLALVSRHWVSAGPLQGLLDWNDSYDQVVKHMIRNRDDWSTVEFFRNVGAFSGGDHRFALFVEGLLTGSVNPSENRQRELVGAISPVLARAGLKVVESGPTDGYPDFRIVSLQTRSRPAQLILFASSARKPQLRVRDVLEQEIEVMAGDDTVLAYDQRVGDRGLTWDELQSWWSRRRAVSDQQAKRELWVRLRRACDEASPAQLRLFDAYHDYAKSETPLFALLPEVWLHWDPASRSQRGDAAYLSQRMDFLMLLPGGRRVVLEVDGAQHYSTPSGQPSPSIYSETTRSDRDLRLSGYEVYRFSGHELTGERVASTTADFFARLLHQS